MSTKETSFPDSYFKENQDASFVRMTIPQKDSGYAWITASLSGTATDGNLAFYGSFNSEITLPTGSTSY
jgi:hypothetical protein